MSVTKQHGGRRVGTRVRTAVAVVAAGTTAVGLTVLPAGAAQPTGASSSATPLSSSAAAALAKDATHKVIVVLKDQPRSEHVGSAAQAGRSAHIRTAQKPVLSELGRVKAKRVKSYDTVNALAATVSSGEVSRLKANPAVASVVPDSIIRLAPQQQTPKPSATGSGLTPHVIPGACGANGKVQLEPEALATTSTNSDDAKAKTARSLGYTGKGVKVAYIAEGIDPNNVNFVKPDGKSVFTDYQDFSGDGPNAPTPAAEAFLDATAIAGQGRHVYDVRNFSAQTYPTACKLRIEGTAPGVDLVGLKVFSNGYTTTSAFLQAINYAVQTDHVNVLNESFGSDNFPDTAADVTKQFNDAAVAAGVTVTVSTGDAGIYNTQGSPSTDPKVLALGASTTFRWYAQTNYALARDVATTGWLNDNISSLSSGGYTTSGRVPDLVAPGDSSFASCTASPKYAECLDLLNRPSDVSRSGGTSESAPLAAGIAALVIQAYRQGHGGATPTPAEVKQILTSSARDLAAPATEQGAGQIDAYRAVLLAKSFASKKTAGDTLALSTDQVNAVGKTGERVRRSFTVTNNGSRAQKVQLSGRQLGGDNFTQRGSVDLEDATSPKVTDFQGLPNNYALVHFVVKPGQDRLDVSIAYPGDPALGNNQRVRIVAVDPKGRFAGHSLPQGVGNHGEFDVQHPVAGRWTGLIFGITKSNMGTNGVVQWRATTQRYHSFASLSPSSFSLAPGKSRTVQATATTPASPGDSSGSIVVTSGASGQPTFDTTVSFTLRSLIDPAKGGKFRGTLTGGNGRPPGQGQEQFYEFRVGKGVHDITASVSFPSDPANPVAEYLVSPDGNVLGYGQNEFGSNSYNVLDAHTVDPEPGLWTLIVDFASPVEGDLISQPYSGSVRFDTTRASAKGLPTSTKVHLAAGKPVTIPVTLTNTGKAPEVYFLDPRLNTETAVTLDPLTSNAVTLPIDPATGPPLYFVPTQTSSVVVRATGSRPITFDYQPGTGDPDIGASAPGPGPLCSTAPSSSYTPSGGRATSGIWLTTPATCGPYTDAGAPSTKVTVNATVATKAFDTTVTSSTGDLEQTAYDAGTTARPVALVPGQSVTVRVTITPRGVPGSQVKGRIYVDEVSTNVPPYGQFAGSEVTSLPYAYTID